MKNQRKSQFRLSSLNERCKDKFLLPLATHRRLKSLNKALDNCLPISRKLKRKLAQRINVPTCLIKANIVNPKNFSNE